MALSTTVKEAMYSQQTELIAIFLLTVTHPDLPEQVLGGGSAGTFRFARARNDIVSNGDTFYALPFDLRLPIESHEEQAKIILALEGPSADLINILRGLVEAPEILIELVLANALNDIEDVWLEGKWRNIQWNKDSISGEVRWDDLQDLPYPADIFDNIRFPGLF